MAVIFAISVAAVGILLARRRPWKDEETKTAVAKVFALLSLPFIVGEVITGVLSVFVRELRIPPLFDVGTLVDVAILVAGLLLPVGWSMVKKEKQPTTKAR